MTHESVKVLIAEDDYLVSRMIRGLLLERGYQVVGQATNGLEAIDMTASLEPDVVLMDVQMPDMDGIEASRRIQAQCPTPIIVLTAYEALSLVQQAADAGVAAYLVKPPSARDLEHAIVIATARFEDMLALKHVTQELQAANRELDAFSQTVAHDLRHLLSPILGYAEVLYEEYDSTPKEEARRDLSIIIQVARDMNHLIEDLLFLAQVRQQDVPSQPVAMADVVREAQRRLEYMVAKHHVRIQVAQHWPVVLGYEPWLVQVWINYLSNAIKYGGETPLVVLGWDDAPLDADGQPWVRCWVKDYGIGIAESVVPHIFDSFRDMRRTGRKGHGLGLSIVRRIIEKLGGQVSVESTVGEGSTFSFTLPRASTENGR